MYQGLRRRRRSRSQRLGRLRAQWVEGAECIDGLECYIVHADEDFVGQGGWVRDVLDSGSFKRSVEDESFHFGQ